MSTETYNWNELLSKIIEEPELETQTDTKAYSFVNRYMHEKQYGIQTAHALARLTWLDKSQIVFDYMKGEQKLIVLNGGGARDMRKTLINIGEIDSTYFSIQWFNDIDINPQSPSAIVVIPSRKMQHIIDEVRANSKGRVRVSGNLLLNGKDEFMLKSTPDGLNQAELELVEKIVNGRTV